MKMKICIHVVGAGKLSLYTNSFLFHLINTGAKGSQDRSTIKEERRDRGTQPGGSSKENQGRKTTDGESGQFWDGGVTDRGTRMRDNTESGILVDYLLPVVTCKYK